MKTEGRVTLRYLVLFSPPVSSPPPSRRKLRAGNWEVNSHVANAWSYAGPRKVALMGQRLMTFKKHLNPPTLSPTGPETEQRWAGHRAQSQKTCQTAGKIYQPSALL